MNSELLQMLESFLSLFEMMALSLEGDLVDIVLERIFELRQKIDMLSNITTSGGMTQPYTNPFIPSTGGGTTTPSTFPSNIPWKQWSTGTGGNWAGGTSINNNTSFDEYKEYIKSIGSNKNIK